MIVAVIAVTAIVVARHVLTPREGLIQVSGRVESDDVTLASRVTGKVIAIRVREGDTTRTHEVMALLDDRTNLCVLAGYAAALIAVSLRAFHKRVPR